MAFIKRKNGESLRNETGGFLRGRFFWPEFFEPMLDIGRNGIDHPLANISESGDEYQLELFVPGQKKEDFIIDVVNNTLTVSYYKESTPEHTKEQYTRREFSSGNFSRSFLLPEHIHDEKIVATYKDGILKIIIPKKELKVLRAKKAVEVI
jgi:HSP20 family protein